jgi:hypothetical protein
VVNELRRLHVLRSRTFQNEADYLQISWFCNIMMNLV